jgi:hypothetical protein
VNDIIVINKFIYENRTDIEKMQDALKTCMVEIVDLPKLALESYNARLTVYPALREVIFPLAQRGWFISKFFGLSEIDALAKSVEIMSLDELEQHLYALYREDISDHVECILEKYPERAFVIQPAIDAHFRKEYAISIPIFFAQTDGICFESPVAKHLFSAPAISSNDKYDDELRSKAIELIGDKNPVIEFYALLSEIIWISLTKKLPIGYNQKERNDYNYRGLNRNTFLHGVANENDATEENSLKAFSLLSYMSALLDTTSDISIRTV